MINKVLDRWKVIIATGIGAILFQLLKWIWSKIPCFTIIKNVILRLFMEHDLSVWFMYIILVFTICGVSIIAIKKDD